jgi:hypothetical protein
MLRVTLRSTRHSLSAGRMSDGQVRAQLTPIVCDIGGDCSHVPDREVSPINTKGVI